MDLYTMKLLKSTLLILQFFITYIYALDIHEIKHQKIFEAMDTQKGYDITATTNVARFQLFTLIQVAKNSLKQNPSKKLLYLNYLEWRKAYKMVSKLKNSQFPEFSNCAIIHKQNLLLDLRENKVIKKVIKGPQPKFAFNVILGWPKTIYSKEFFFFNDTLSTPNLRVRNNRVITYRILDFGHMVMYDDINGIYGKPSTGIFGLIFKFISEARIIWSKITINVDEIQITRAKAKKGIFEIESTVTIYPNGFTLKNLPSKRHDLEQFEKYVTQTVEIKYFPIEKKIIDLICKDETKAK